MTAAAASATHGPGRKVLVTGASGLLGEASVRAFDEAGWQVVALMRPASSRVLPEGVQTLTKDLSQIGAEDLEGFDAVLHLAARTYSAEMEAASSGRPRDAREILATNVSSTESLFRSAVRAGVPAVVFASTQGVYGPAHMRPAAEEPLSALGPFLPDSLYSVSKLVNESLASYYAFGSTTSFVGIRPTFSYGIGRLTGVIGSFTRFILDAWRHEPAVLPAPFGRDSSLQLIYVEDMARGFVRSAELALGSTPGGAALMLNAPSTEARSVPEIIDILTGITGNRRISVELDRGDPGIQFPRLDTASACEILQFQPSYPLPEASRDIAQRAGLST